MKTDINFALLIQANVIVPIIFVNFGYFLVLRKLLGNVKYGLNKVSTRQTTL